MQSLDSSCQEADFIINDTLKKLKGSNAGSSKSNTDISNTNSLTVTTTLAPAAAVNQQQQQQQQHHQQQLQATTYSHYHHLPSALQNFLESAGVGHSASSSSSPSPSPASIIANHTLTNLKLPPSQLSGTLSTDISASSVTSVTFPSKNSLLDSSLLHCNISHIPSQPPVCIFDDGTESPTELPPVEILAAPSTANLGTSSSNGSNVTGAPTLAGHSNALGLSNIVILTETPQSTISEAGGGSIGGSGGGCLPAAVTMASLSSQSLPSGATISITASPLSTAATVSSATTNLSSFNSITSPSPVVPDLLLSTPPGVNVSCSSGNGSGTTVSCPALTNASGIGASFHPPSSSVATSQLYSHNQQQQQQQQPHQNLQQNHNSNNNNSNNNNNIISNRKAEKRPPITSSMSTATHIVIGSMQQQNSGNNHGQQQHAHNHHHQQAHLLTSTSATSSPTSSPSKRQKTKDPASSSTAIRSSNSSNNSSTTNANINLTTSALQAASSAVASSRGAAGSSSIGFGGSGGAGAGANASAGAAGTAASTPTAATSAPPQSFATPGTNTSTSSSSMKRESTLAASAAGSSSSSTSYSLYSSTQKFININDKIREMYLQLFANDMLSFTETGRKQRTRSFVLERLVENEHINTIVINLYPGNKGYALALHYDDRQMIQVQQSMSGTDDIVTVQLPYNINDIIAGNAPTISTPAGNSSFLSSALSALGSVTITPTPLHSHNKNSSSRSTSSSLNSVCGGINSKLLTSAMPSDSKAAISSSVSSLANSNGTNYNNNNESDSLDTKTTTTPKLLNHHHYNYQQQQQQHHHHHQLNQQQSQKSEKLKMMNDFLTANSNTGGSSDSASLSALHEYALIEVLRWPYENDQLLQCIDRETLPDFLMDMLCATTLTVRSGNDDGVPARVYHKPNVFYAGCVIAEIRDFRQTFAISTNICDTRHVLLRPTNATIFAEVQHLADTIAATSAIPIGSSSSSSSSGNVSGSSIFANSGSTTNPVLATEDKLQIESQIVLATAEPLCLDPDPAIGRYAINAQHVRQVFNTSAMRRQMRKYTQVSINRKRKLDQFTHHYGLELCDYLTRIRSRPRSMVTGNGATSGAGVGASSSANATAPSSNPLGSAMLTTFTSRVPRRPREVIKAIRPPRLEYPAQMKVPENLINVEKFAKTYERPRETTDCQPQLIEEYILETEREDNEGRRLIYHIKLSIFQRPSNSEYLGELYVDRDYRDGEKNGESCRFSLGTRVHANRYIQQFTEIFTEEGRKAVKITHLVPGHLPKVTHTGMTPEQRQALLQQQQQQIQLQQQRQAAAAAALLTAHQQQQQQSQQQQQQVQHHQQVQQHQHAQHVVVVGSNGQQQHIIPARVQHITTGAAGAAATANLIAAGPQQHIALAAGPINQQNITLAQKSAGVAGSSNSKNVNIVGITTASGPQNISASASPHIHVQSTPNPGGMTTHQLSLSNGSLVLVQQHAVPAANSQSGVSGVVAQHSQQQQQQHHQVLAQALQHTTGITIQPATVSTLTQQQQKKQIIAAGLSGINNVSALRSQLNAGANIGVPMLQEQLKSGNALPQQLQKQQAMATIISNSNVNNNTSNINNNTNNSNNNPTATLHTNPDINAIVTSIMNTANQFQQQQQQQQLQSQANILHSNVSTAPNTSFSIVASTVASNHLNANTSTTAISSTSTTTSLKNANNASILSLLNSAPAAMTSTPVASGTFTSSTTGNHQHQQQHLQQSQQTVTLVAQPVAGTSGHHLTHQQQQQQPSQQHVTAEGYVQATTTQTLQPNPSQQQQQQQQRKHQQNEVLQNLLNQNRKINVVASAAGGGGNIIAGSVGNAANIGTTTFRTNAGNLIAVNLNSQATQASQQQQLHGEHHHKSQTLPSTQQQSQQQAHASAVRVSMSALASQLASPPAIMTNPGANYAYTLSSAGSSSGASNAGASTGGVTGGGNIKILNTGVQQQRSLVNALRRESLVATAGDAIVVGLAAPSPGSDSNASNASAGFVIPQVASTNSTSAAHSSLTPPTSLNALLASTTPSPSGSSDHSSQSQNVIASATSQNQVLLERLNSNVGGSAVVGTISNMTSPSPQQQQQFLAKALVQSPATSSSIHSPMSSPHPQPSPSPQLQQQHLNPQQQSHQHQPSNASSSNSSTTTTLNLQALNLQTLQGLQGAISNFPGVQNVQLQLSGLSGFAQPISLQLSGNGNLQATAVPAVAAASNPNTATVSVVAAGGNATGTAPNNCQQTQTTQRSLLVSVPVSSSTGGQPHHQQHTITLQAASQQNALPTGTIVSLPAGSTAAASGTQTLVLTNTGANAGSNTGTLASSVIGNTGSTGNNAGSTGNSSGSAPTTTMLTLQPITQIVGPGGVQKLNPQAIRASSVGSGGGGGVTGANILIQQQQSQQQQQQQTQASPRQQQQQQQHATISVNSVQASNLNSNMIATSASGGGGAAVAAANAVGNAGGVSLNVVGNNPTASIQLVGTIQQRPRNIQVFGAKHLANRQLIAAQRNIGASTLKIAAATPINANTANAITTTANLTATPIVMSAQKLHLKAIKSPQTQQQQQQQQQQIQHRILNQITASAASQAAASANVAVQQQQAQQNHLQQQQQQSSATAVQQQQQQTIILGQTTVASAGAAQQPTSQQQQMAAQIAVSATPQQQQQLQQLRAAGMNQRTITAITATAVKQQTPQDVVANAAVVAAANRRRSATDVNK